MVGKRRLCAELIGKLPEKAKYSLTYNYGGIKFTNGMRVLLASLFIFYIAPVL